MNHISPCNHTESYLTGSTVESMIDRAKELGNTHFAITDHGRLSSIVRGYNYAKSNDIKPIAGVEIFFKDIDCDIVADTESALIKYFKFVIHAKDQVAFQQLVKISSDLSRKKIMIAEDEYPVFNWKDLEEIAKYNVTVTNANIEDMVTKHILVGRPDLGAKYYQKIKSIFGKNYYPSIVPYEHSKYWDTVVEVHLDHDKVVYIPAFDRIETNKYKKAKAIELTRPHSQHKYLTHVYINKIRYPVAEKHQKIESANLLKKFQDLPDDLQTKANKMIIALAKKLGDYDRLLINNYSYYAHEGDKVVQDMKLGEEKRIYQNQHMSSIEEVTPYLHIKLGFSADDLGNLMYNSKRWAEQFDEFNLKYNYKLPDAGDSPEKQLIDIVKKVGRMKWDDPRYTQQFKEEFELLTKNGVINLVPYFLPIVDVFDYYKQNGYLTGPARGSAGGFLISYLIGITHIDPIKYGLSTSRFLTMDRVKGGNLPDIDCDLESRVPLVGKDGNGGYLFDRWGDKAAQVSTRTLLRIKSAILDANRFVNKGTLEPEIQALSKSLPNTPQGISDHDFVFGYDKDGEHQSGLFEINEDLQKYAEERPKEWDIVKRALSLSRQNSRHACAFIISDVPIDEVVPIFEVGGVKRVTQYEHKHCEWAGLIKYDFLVVDAVKKARVCLDYINKKNNDDMETGCFIHNDKKTFVWDLPEDPEVFNMLWEGKTETVFQLNSTTATPLVMDIKPENITDCAVITSLGRPGPLDFKDEKTGRNMAEEYGYRKRGQSRSHLEIMHEMLPETYGVLVFQEQVTKLAKELAGMSVEDAENVRIGMGKKKIKLLNSLKPVFIEGAAKKIGQSQAEEVWEMMATFARYGFNKSHAVAYSVISYACAFFKKHYPLEWWAAVLSTSDDKKINEEYYKYVKDMILPPDINVSTEEISIDYERNKIRSKLSMITGLGKKAADKIIDGRPYKNIQDFVNRKVAGPSLTRKLIHVGVLDSLFESKMTLLEKMQTFEDACKKYDFDMKIKSYEEQQKNLPKNDNYDKEFDKIEKRKLKYIEKGYKRGKIDPAYMMLTPKKDFLMKKSVFPTMNLDLNKILLEDSETPIFKGASYPRVMDKTGKEWTLVSGEHLQRLDNTKVTHEVKFACASYVIESGEFTYAGGQKKALKLILDSSGYISEKVLWSDYNTGELIYPQELKKGSLVYIFYKRNVSNSGKYYTNILDIIIEEEAL